MVNTRKRESELNRGRVARYNVMAAPPLGFVDWRVSLPSASLAPIT